MLLKFYLAFGIVLLSLSFGVAKKSKFVNPCNAGGFQGDVALSDEDLLSLLSRRSKRAVTNERERIWPHGIIPYEISDQFDGNEKAVIQSAIRHWESNTCISFVERQSQTEYAVFQNDGDCGCCSYVGRMGDDQAQGVNLGRNCIRNGTIAHEIGHLIGFWHEHTRPDRDRYVEILRRNVLNGELKNFRKLGHSEVNSFNVPYDFGSIMHYAKYTFSKNGFEITIQPRAGLYSSEIGQRIRLSPLDIQQANFLYDCPACGKTFTESKQNFSFLTSELKVMKPTTCSWRILWTAGEKLKLKLNYAFFNFKCKRAYLEIRDGKHKKSPLRGRFCKGKPPPKEIVSSSTSLFLTFHYGYRYFYDGPPVGFKAEYEISCGGVINANEGLIQSPNYPENYKENQKCNWEIVVPKGAKVAVKFLMFKLEKSDDCEYDHVELIDGATNKRLRKFCGVRLPKQYIISSSNKMKIRFRSDGNVHLGGFSLKFLSEIDECKTGSHNCSSGCKNTIGGYECYCPNGQQLHSNGRDCERACGKIYTAYENTGVIKSPSYPSNYPINRQCTWEIRAQKGYKIILDIMDFDLEDNKVCNPNYDYLEIKAGKFNEKFCGVVDTPKRIESESNYMMINFNSDNTVSGRGFKARFVHIKDFCAINNGGCSQNCTNTATSPKCSCKYGYMLKQDLKTCVAGACNKRVNSTKGKGSIISPDYPNLYYSNKPCKWHVFTTPGQRFNVTLKDFSCETRMSSLKIWWSLGRKKISEQICDVKKSKQIHVLTDGNIFNIDFAMGSFNLEYTSVCGGKLTASRKPKRFYSHLKFGRENYPPNQNCKWLIYARGRKRKIQLTFKKFKLEEKPCNFDYIKVYDGNKAIEDKQISTECGQNLQQRVYTSTGPYLVVVFRSDTSVSDMGFEAEYFKIRARSKRHHIRLFDPFNDAVTPSRTRDFYF